MIKMKHVILKESFDWFPGRIPESLILKSAGDIVRKATPGLNPKTSERFKYELADIITRAAMQFFKDEKEKQKSIED